VGDSSPLVVCFFGICLGEERINRLGCLDLYGILD